MIRATSALAAAAALTLVFAGCGGTAHPTKPAPAKHAAKASVLFSQTADRGTLTPAGHGKLTLTLHGVEEQTVWFQDRPGRKAGQVPTRDFVLGWNKLFAKDAPNAALNLLDAKESEDTLIVELEHRPRYQPATGTLRFTVRVLHDNTAVRGLHGDRSIPRRFTDASLFIDDVNDIIVVSGTVAEPTPNVAAPGDIQFTPNPRLAFDRNGKLCQINRIFNGVCQ